MTASIVNDEIGQHSITAKLKRQTLKVFSYFPWVSLAFAQSP
jgi:hypothetical protein